VEDAGGLSDSVLLGIGIDPKDGGGGLIEGIYA